MLKAYPGTTASATLISVTSTRIMLVALLPFNRLSQELTIDSEYGCLVNHLTSA